MEDCILANTGSSPINYIIIAGIILLASIALFILYTNRKDSSRLPRTLASFALVLTILAGLASLVAPVALAGGGTNECSSQKPSVTSASQASQNGNSQNNQGGQAGITCPTGWVVVPGNPAYSTTDFCLMKYNAKNVGGTVMNENDFGNGFISYTYSGGVATSQASGQPWANISQTDALVAAQTATTGAHLITENEWMTIAHNVLMQPANWCDADGSNCGAAPGTSGKVLVSGHNDGLPNMPLEASASDAQACYGTVTPGTDTLCGSEPGTQKRTLALSNGEIIWDLAGNVLHWTSGTETRGNLPSNGGSGGVFEYNLDTGFGLPVPDSWGTLAYINPSVHNPLAANWGIAQGVGFLNSDFSSGSPSVFAFMRGGSWDGGPYAGAFTLGLGYTPGDFDSLIGFRSAR